MSVLFWVTSRPSLVRCNFLNWRIIAFQCCVDICCITSAINIHISPLSWAFLQPSHPTPLGHHRATEHQAEPPVLSNRRHGVLTIRLQGKSPSFSHFYLYVSVHVVCLSFPCCSSFLFSRGGPVKWLQVPVVAHSVPSKGSVINRRRHGLAVDFYIFPACHISYLEKHLLSTSKISSHP